MADFQAVKRQFAADDDRRPPDPRPAVIVRILAHDHVFGNGHFPVKRRVQELDDLVVDDQGTRDPDFLAKAQGDALGKRGLAIARRAVQEQSRPRVDGRSQTGK